MYSSSIGRKHTHDTQGAPFIRQDPAGVRHPTAVAVRLLTGLLPLQANFCIFQPLMMSFRQSLQQQRYDTRTTTEASSSVPEPTNLSVQVLLLQLRMSTAAVGLAI